MISDLYFERPLSCCCGSEGPRNPKMKGKHSESSSRMVAKCTTTSIPCVDWEFEWIEGSTIQIHRDSGLDGLDTSWGLVGCHCCKMGWIPYMFRVINLREKEGTSVIDEFHANSHCLPMRQFHAWIFQLCSWNKRQRKSGWKMAWTDSRRSKRRFILIAITVSPFDVGWLKTNLFHSWSPISRNTLDYEQERKGTQHGKRGMKMKALLPWARNMKKKFQCEKYIHEKP